MVTDGKREGVRGKMGYGIEIQILYKIDKQNILYNTKNYSHSLHQSVLLMFSSRSFMIWGFTFRSLIHLEFILYVLQGNVLNSLINM